MMPSSTYFSSRIQNILYFVRNEFSKNITLDMAAANVNLSKYYFDRIFKREIGVSFKQYVNIYRLCKSAELLRSSNDLVSYICFDIGFNDISNFIKQFRRYLGCSPIKYRTCSISPAACRLRQKMFQHNTDIYGEKINEALGLSISSLCYLNRGQ
jgi:AraC-like DNA-binding protein